MQVQECQLGRKHFFLGWLVLLKKETRFPFIAPKGQRPDSLEHRSSPSYLGDDKQPLHNPR